MALLDGDPTSKAYYTVRLETFNKKTRQRKYAYTPAVYLDPFAGIQLSNKYEHDDAKTSVTPALYQWDYTRRAWIVVPGSSPFDTNTF